MACQVCKSNEALHYKTIDGVPIYRCLLCELAFVDPKTPRKTTTNIYSFIAYQKRENQFIKRYTNTVHLISKFIHGKKILEVGAGFGLLSSLLHRAGYDVDVLEPDVDTVYLKGLSVKVFKTYLEEYANVTSTKYDAIILYDVLEHVDFPVETVKLFEKLLLKNGIVFIQTPNYQSLMAQIVRNWSWWMVEDHRFFFSKKSLGLLFERKNWKKLFYKSTEEWTDFKKNLDGNFRSKISKLFLLSIFIPLYFLFRGVIWQIGYGGLHMAIWQYNKR